MSRLATLALVAGMGVLALAAVVDAFRAAGPAEPTPAQGAGESGDELVVEIEAAGIAGRLLYTDAGDCTLRGLELPSLAAVDVPPWATCAFTLGPDGAVAADGAVFDRQGLRAEEMDGGVDVLGTGMGAGRRFDEARAPAFHPDGTLTLVQRGALVALSPCPERLGGCRSTIVTEGELTSLARLSVEPLPVRLAVDALAWLDEWTFVVLAEAGESDVLLAVRTDEQEPDVDVWFEDETLGRLEPSPRGDHLSVVMGTGQLAVFDAEGTVLGLHGTQVRGAAWSPDGRWVAVLDGDGVLFVDAATGDEVGPVALAARDLAWG